MDVGNRDSKMIFFFDPRFAFPIHILFWGNIMFPALTLLWSFTWLCKKKVWTLQTLLIGLLVCTVPNTVFSALVSVFESKYYLTLGAGTINQYLMFVVADLLFFDMRNYLSVQQCNCCMEKQISSTQVSRE